MLKARIFHHNKNACASSIPCYWSKHKHHTRCCNSVFFGAKCFCHAHILDITFTCSRPKWSYNEYRVHTICNAINNLKLRPPHVQSQRMFCILFASDQNKNRKCDETDNNFTIYTMPHIKSRTTENVLCTCKSTDCRGCRGQRVSHV